MARAARLWPVLLLAMVLVALVGTGGQWLQQRHRDAAERAARAQACPLVSAYAGRIGLLTSVARATAATAAAARAQGAAHELVEAHAAPVGLRQQLLAQARADSAAARAYSSQAAALTDLPQLPCG